MSDYRVVAAAMQTLQNMLQDAIGEAVPGAVVRTGPPEEEAPDQVAEGLVKVFLFRVEPNPTWRNAELPVRGPDGRVVRQPQMAVNLDILFSFYGSEQRKVPYLLLGLTLAVLHAEPYPSVRFMPRAAPAGGNGSPDPVSASLAGSGLAQQAHAFRLSLLPLGHDELFPLFSHIPFVMSVAYRAQVLLIEPFADPEPALPVRRADVFLQAAPPPGLERAVPAVLPYSPGAEVELLGEHLDSASSVLFDELPGEILSASPGRLRVVLPDGIQAGLRLVRVVRQAAPGSDGKQVPAVESNPLALAVAPVVRGVRARLAADGETVDLGVEIAPSVRASTPVSILLNPIPAATQGSSPSATSPRRGHVFTARADPESPSRVEVALSPDAGVAPGSYLVRVQIDGVTSRLEVGSDGTFSGPRVEVPAPTQGGSGDASGGAP